jgi:hypothetical protein
MSRVRGSAREREREREVYIGYFFKFHLKVGVEESIVNAPLVSLQSKNTNNVKSEVSFKQLIRNPDMIINNNIIRRSKKFKQKQKI